MIYYNEKGKIDKFATWVNNCKWSWVIPVLCILIGGLIEGM